MPLAITPESMLSQLGSKDALLTSARSTPGATPAAKLRTVIETRIWAFVQGSTSRHLLELAEQHALISGERPPHIAGEIGNAEQAMWDSELDDAFRASLNDYVPGVISVSDAERLTVDARLDDKAKREQTAEQLAKAIVSGPWSLESITKPLGITDEDMTSLAGEPEPRPVVGTVPETTGASVNDAQRELVVTVLREFLVTPDGDVMDAMTWLNEMAQLDNTLAHSAAQHLGYKAPLAAVPIVRALSGKQGWIDELLAEAVKPAPDPKANKMAEKAAQADKDKADNGGKPGSKRGAKECAPAIRAAFEVLLDTTDMTEASLSSMLGISRAQLNNIRKGERGYEPNDPAKVALTDAFTTRIAKLSRAAADLMEA